MLSVKFCFRDFIRAREFALFSNGIVESVW